MPRKPVDPYIYAPEGKREVVRVNFAFTKENMDFLKIMSDLAGISITAYINEIVAEERTRSATEYDRAKELMEMVRRKREAASTIAAAMAEQDLDPEEEG